MEQTLTLNAIAADTIKGLSAPEKYLLPRYFYDDRGSRIFQDIMQMPEYYLTDCEYELLQSNKTKISSSFIEGSDQFDIIELGSGDGTKTRVVINQLLSMKSNFRYLPVDISHQVTDELIRDLGTENPTLDVLPQTGDYFEILDELKLLSSNRKVILFLGANIGNFSDDETDLFMSKIMNLTSKGDRIMIGFDMKKSPEIIMKAYNDPHGHTRDFNLNLLRRINNELGADFNLDQFEHHTEYDPLTGDVKSFLISKENQEVYLSELDAKVRFRKWEPVFMERSRKFDYESIRLIAERHGFIIENNFVDNKGYFTDSVWLRE